MNPFNKAAPVASGGEGQNFLTPGVYHVGGLVRVSKSRRCPICGRADWCSITADGALAICMREPAGSFKCTKNGDFLHRLRETQWRRGNLRTVTVSDRPPSRHDFALLVQNYGTAANPERLQRFANSLGLSIGSLKHLSMGWCSEKRAWSFPMRNGAGDVLGIRLRTDAGCKFAIPGSREGLFIPSGLSSSGPLLICEGPTDCAAMLDLGFAAIGRPSCTGGIKLLANYARQRKPAGIVIGSDSDEPGRCGAEALANVLSLYHSVRIIVPPSGIKDLRQWKFEGASASCIQAAIDAATVRVVRVVGRRFNQGVHHG